MKILALSPHPDDVELGAGGTIARLVSERTASLQIIRFSRCDTSLNDLSTANQLVREASAAAKVLSAKATNVQRDIPVRHFPEHRQAILEDLVALRDAFEPDLVFVPSAHDDHQDHATVFAEAMRAFKHTTILGYEAPWNNRSCETDLFVTLRPTHVDTKLEALAIYKSQQHRRYMHPDFIRSWLYVRGIQAGCGADGRPPAAEAFEVVRAIL